MEWSAWPPYAAFSLGLVTAISPCPLATNIAAVAFVSRRYTAMGWVVADTVAYTLGRALTYTVLALLIQVLSVKVAHLANPMMTVAEWALGPILVLVGLILMNVIPLTFGSGGLQERFVRASGKLPLLSSLLLGVGFALAFCPLSGALYFGGLIPLTLKSPSGFFLGLIYGIGTALPVLGVGLLLAFSLKTAERLISGLQKLDRWIRPTVGFVFIAIGLYEIILLVRNRI